MVIGGPTGGQTAGTGTGEREVVDVAMVNGRPEVRDKDTGELLMEPCGPSFFANISLPRDGLEASVEYILKPNGFDIVAEFFNPTNTTKSLKSMNLATLSLGRDIKIPDMRWGGRERSMSLDNVQPIVELYPNDLYSPVAVLANDTHAVGLSVLYPVLEYKHDVSFAYRAAPGSQSGCSTGQGWVIYIHFSPITPNSTVVANPATLDPGDSRSYRFTVRFTDKPDEWQRTLVPYRDFFAETYGPVKYERDPTPVIGYSIATSSAQNANNPDGWARGRPDIHGFRELVTGMISENADQKRILVWAPTGLYQHGQNFPWQFTSRWLDTPELRTAFDTRDGFPRVAQAGKQLGLWWGRTGRYIPVWNPDRSDVVDFDINNPVHRQDAFREMDLAVQAGATLIGLDAMTLPLWETVQWLEILKQRYPGVTFVLEPKQSDILNNIAPMYTIGYGNINNGPTPRERTNIRGPNYIADFINPGHEIWAALRWDQYWRERGQGASNAIKEEDARHAAANGFVPLLFDAVPRSETFNAAESWKFTVPADLRPDSGSGNNNTGGSGNNPDPGNNAGNNTGGNTGNNTGNNTGSPGGRNIGGGTSGGPLPGTPNLQRPEQTRSLRTARSMIAGPSDQVLSRLGDEPERRVVTRPSRPRVVVTRDGRVSPPDDE
ncbi:MAG: hypothetical protein EA423_02675 [Phycisphaerales bacterium]|nr:MAG: hypothetical protein EA423_02675 [Phycisphaerales bacterium]